MITCNAGIFHQMSIGVCTAIRIERGVWNDLGSITVFK